MDETDVSSPTSESSSHQYKAKGAKPRRLWTQEEDEKLRLLVSYWGDQCGQNSHWVKISSHFDNRSPKDCRKRWFHSLDPRHKRGRWTETEDRTLVEAYERLGPQWQRVAQLIPGRTDDQCAKRWSDVLDPKISLRLRDWDEAEDRRLLQLIEKHGTKWRIICKEMDGRTGLTCRNRWRKLIRMSEKAQELAERAEMASAQAQGPLPPPPKELSLLEAIMPSGEIPGPSTVAFLSSRSGGDQLPQQLSYNAATRDAVQSGKTYTMTIDDPTVYDGTESGEGPHYALNELDIDKVLDSAAKNGQKVVIHQHIYTIYAGAGHASGIAPRASAPQPGAPAYGGYQGPLPPPPPLNSQTAQESQLPSRDLTPAMGGLPDEFMVAPGMIFDLERQNQAELQLDYLAFNPS